MTRAIPFMLMLALPPIAAAQPAPSPPVNARCTTLAVFAGISFAGRDSRSRLGVLLRDAQPRWHARARRAY
jgi:hypothetical protein